MGATNHERAEVFAALFLLLSGANASQWDMSLHLHGSKIKTLQTNHNSCCWCVWVWAMEHISQAHCSLRELKVARTDTYLSVIKVVYLTLPLRTHQVSPTIQGCTNWPGWITVCVYLKHYSLFIFKGKYYRLQRKALISRGLEVTIFLLSHKPRVVVSDLSCHLS